MRKFARKAPKRKRLKNGRPTIYAAKRDLHRAQKKIRAAGADASTRDMAKMQKDLDLAEQRVRTIDLMRFEGLLQRKINKVTLQTNFLYKIILQRRNMIILSNAHKDAALKAFDEARKAIEGAFDVALIAQKKGEFVPSPLQFGKTNGDAHARSH